MPSTLAYLLRQVPRLEQFPVPVMQLSLSLKQEGIVVLDVKKAGTLEATEVGASFSLVSSAEMMDSTCRRRSSCDLSDHRLGLVDWPAGRRTRVVSISPALANAESFAMLSVTVLRTLESCQHISKLMTEWRRDAHL